MADDSWLYDKQAEPEGQRIGVTVHNRLAKGMAGVRDIAADTLGKGLYKTGEFIGDVINGDQPPAAEKPAAPEQTPAPQVAKPAAPKADLDAYLDAARGAGGGAGVSGRVGGRTPGAGGDTQVRNAFLVADKDQGGVTLDVHDPLPKQDYHYKLDTANSLLRQAAEASKTGDSYTAAALYKASREAQNEAVTAQKEFLGNWAATTVAEARQGALSPEGVVRRIAALNGELHNGVEYQVSPDGKHFRKVTNGKPGQSFPINEQSALQLAEGAYEYANKNGFVQDKELAMKQQRADADTTNSNAAMLRANTESRVAGLSARQAQEDKAEYNALTRAYFDPKFADRQGEIRARLAMLRPQLVDTKALINPDTGEPVQVSSFKPIEAQNAGKGPAKLPPMTDEQMMQMAKTVSKQSGYPVEVVLAQLRSRSQQ